MTEEQHEKYLEEMTKTIEATIKIVVNGKIDGMRRELSDFSKETRDWRENEFNEYVKEDKEWKEIATPIIKAGVNLTGAGKIAVALFGGIGIIAAGVTAIRVALKLLLQ